MWYARKRGEAAKEVTGSCRKKNLKRNTKRLPDSDGKPSESAGRTQEGKQRPF